MCVMSRVIFITFFYEIVLKENKVISYQSRINSYHSLWFIHFWGPIMYISFFTVYNQCITLLKFKYF